jgi:Fur family ferric uptake transcriptional regulator
VDEELSILRAHLAENGMRLTEQRLRIVRAFLATEGHMTVEDVYRLPRLRNANVGLATVYRTLKLLTKCGLAQARRFRDGSVRYEHHYGHEHHDHLVCIQCHRVTEFENPTIEALQREVFEKNDFVVDSHRLDLFGICSDCRKRERAGRRRS